MDTIASKTPATLPFAAWQAMTPDTAARTVHERLAALPPLLRSAALAWLRPEKELAEEINAQRPTRPLRGVPYLLKDLFDLTGVPTRAGSTFLPQVRPTPTRDSAIVTLLRERGAACAGKTHLVEFASGLTGENPHYGDCPHPHFADRLSGGSSSGSAALVAAGITPLAIGTDTGGSVRVPAAFCGLHGFRLTPRDPLIHDAFPLAPTMDTAGWFTANAGDMLTTWQALVPGRSNPPDEPSGRSPADSALPHGCFLPMSALVPEADPEVAHACDAAAAEICRPADRATEDHLADAWRKTTDAYITIGMSEAHAIHRDWLAPYRDQYDPVIWQRFTAAGQYPREQIAGARKILQETWIAWREFFFNYDYLIVPAVPCPAPHKVECTPELRRQILTLGAPASLGGLPVLSLPLQLPSGLTAGLQVIVPVPDSPVIPWLLKR